MPGPLSDLPCTNGWTLAEQAEDATPYGLQHLLARAEWDADTVRDDIRGFVVEVERLPSRMRCRSGMPS